MQNAVKDLQTKAVQEEAISIMDAAVLNAANEQIKRIEPIVKAHGGGVEVVRATKDQVIIAISGHCAGCPMAPITYGKILTKYIQEALPQLKEIKYIEKK